MLRAASRRESLRSAATLQRFAGNVPSSSCASTAAATTASISTPPASPLSPSLPPPPTPPSAQSTEPPPLPADSDTLYCNPRRLQSAGLTALAGTQTAVWAWTANLSAQAVDPLLAPAWTAGGLLLSSAFAAMIAAYLRRTVAHLTLLPGPRLRVTPHGLAGALGTTEYILPQQIVAGPHRDAPVQRHWTFGVRQPSGRVYYYILDMHRGVLDHQALAALVNGGDHLLAWSHKRDAERMIMRWSAWRQHVAQRKASHKR